MINLAVVEIKDVIKYLVKITVVITVLIGLTRYFSSFKTKIDFTTKEIQAETFLSCLDTTIPSIKEWNQKDEENNIGKTNTTGALKMALGVELGMMNSLSKEDGEEKTNTTQEENTIQNEEKSNNKEIIEEVKTGLETEIQETNVPEKFTTTYNTVKIKNETKIKLTEEILTPNVNINMKNLLIYHTHSCESYTPSEKYTYKASGNFRTTDKECSVIRVGTELEKYMKNYGYHVIHDTTLYDYPSYNGSYDRSLNNVEKLLEQNKGTEVLFDIHRDAIRR